MSSLSIPVQHAWVVRATTVNSRTSARSYLYHVAAEQWTAGAGGATVYPSEAAARMMIEDARRYGRPGFGRSVILDPVPLEGALSPADAA